MKRTNIVLNEDLVREATAATGIKTRRALVEHALTELVRREKQKEILNHKGRFEWKGNLETMRESRFQ